MKAKAVGLMQYELWTQDHKLIWTMKVRNGDYATLAPHERMILMPTYTTESCLVHYEEDEMENDQAFKVDLVARTPAGATVTWPVWIRNDAADDAETVTEVLWMAYSRLREALQGLDERSLAWPGSH